MLFRSISTFALTLLMTVGFAMTSAATVNYSDLLGYAFDFTNMSETTTSAGEWTVTIDANTQAMLNVIYGQAQAFATSVSVVWDNKL